jgi:hypothetical protein
MDTSIPSLPQPGAPVRWKGQTGTPGGTVVAVDDSTIVVNWHAGNWSSTFSHGRFVLLCDLIDMAEGRAE